MLPVMVEQGPDRTRLEQLGVFSWPVWSCEVSEFPWTYDQREICYILEGEVIVTPEEGAPIELSSGDLVVFPTGMRCRWDVVKPVRKHYRFG